MMKNNSMNTAPKGSTPPMRIEGHVRKKNGCSPTCRGIWLVRTGCSMRGRLKPTYAPKKHKGTDTRNHSAINANIVPTGTAADDPADMRKKLRKRKVVNTILCVASGTWFCISDHFMYLRNKQLTPAQVHRPTTHFASNSLHQTSYRTVPKQNQRPSRRAHRPQGCS